MSYASNSDLLLAVELELEQRDRARWHRRNYAPRGAAAELFASRAPQVIISGPAGTGKSRAGLQKLHDTAITTRGFRGLIVRKTRASLTETGLVTFERDVLGEDHPLIVGGAQRAYRQSYRYPKTGATVATGGMDKPGKILSGEYDMIYVQQAEELNEHDWEVLDTRLRNGALDYQQLLADCNPDAPQHWIKRRADAGRTLMLESRHEDNPLLWDAILGGWTPKGAAYMARLDALTGVRHYRYRLGRWVAAEGAVYETFDRAMHLVYRREIPKSWRRIRSIDFGYTNPFVCQWWAIDPDGRMWLYREIYMTGRTVKDHAAKIKELEQWQLPDGAPNPERERIAASVADHDAEDRATLEQEGIITQPARKAITVGIQEVEGRLKPAGDGRPRLYIMRDSLVEKDDRLDDAKKPWCTEQEFDGYVWPKGQDGKPVKETPVDKDNHGMDGMRYAAMHEATGLYGKLFY